MALYRRVVLFQALPTVADPATHGRLITDTPYILPVALPMRNPPATHLVVTRQPTDVLANAPFAFTVNALTISGAVDTTFTDTVMITHAFGLGTLAAFTGSLSQACVAGVASFALTIDTIGSGNVLAASASGLTGVNSATFSVGKPANVVFSGDSITYGSLSSNPATKAYPVIAMGGISYATFHNSGLPSQTLGPRSGATSLLVAAPTADYTFFDSGHTNFSVLMIGVNDLASGTDNTATALYNDIRTWITQTKAAGAARCLILTILPNSDTSGQETQRLAFNNLLKANAIGDGAFAVVDMGQDPHFANGLGTGSPSYLDTTYYADQLHLTDIGYAEAGNFIRQAIKDMIANTRAASMGLTSTSGTFVNNTSVPANMSLTSTSGTFNN